MAEETKVVVAEIAKNCPACKKPLRKSRRFYRNGGYYCNNNCYKKVQATAQEALAKAAAEVSEKTEGKEQA